MNMSKGKLAWKIAFGFPAMEMNRCLKELYFIRERMQKLDDPILEGTWQDVAESWSAMFRQLQKVSQ